MDNVMVAYTVSKSYLPIVHRTIRIQDIAYPDAMVGYKRHIQVSDFEGTAYCLAAERNKTFEKATKENVDWLICLDSDAILTNRITQWPLSGYGNCKALALAETDDPYTDRFPYDKDTFIDRSWYILHKSVFSKARLYEGFTGYGWEDFDFVHVVLKSIGIFHTVSDSLALHLWHPVNLELISKTYLVNQKLYEGRRALLANLTNSPL